MKNSIMAIAMATANFAGQASAEASLTGVSCLPENTYFSTRFEEFVRRVNDRGDGVVKIQYLGGAPAIGDPFTVGQRISRGAFDIGSCSGAYYLNTLPIADAFKLLEVDMTEVRANGGWDYMVDLHREVNLLPVARMHTGIPFHLYLADGHTIDSPDLSGLKLRVVPIYTNFFLEQGATTQQTSSNEIFPLMENGTIDGYGWPITGLRPGWESVTKYRVDPGFYDVDIQIVANARVWDGLPDDARTLLEEIALELEGEAAGLDAVDIDASLRAQEGFGFEVITLGDDKAENWLAGARNAGWAGISEIDPEHAKRLRETFASE
ncbi:ABC transporter substrate-binding protein [Ruegeria sp. EL01]|jgi:TRAP-type C4-dicarboxylate transport system substrate-binding protein|uniref:ABC transporter substrate-binding protein n=1 Tax=Ruegeria sp. EL01 TaxID=2107578 RepID=UPI000EA80B33|nr:ABC transporter substrate-binding protein [Ruegeria sp. EL01]